MTTVDTYNTRLATGEQHIGAVGSSIVRVDAEFTRPADTNGYIANDVVSNNTTTTTPCILTNCARVNGGSGYIVKIRIGTDKKSITPRLRLHLFNASNPTVSGDNVPYKAVYIDLPRRVASYDLAALSTAVDTTNSDLSTVLDATVRLPFVCAPGDRNLYGVLEALDAFTPASGERFFITVECDQN